MNQANGHLIGLGHVSEGPLSICVYCANRPPLEPYQSLGNLQPMACDEIDTIAQLTGNHWRKIFNVYAKLMFEFAQTAQLHIPKWVAQQEWLQTQLSVHSWQGYRDAYLLQDGSHTALLFNQPKLTSQATLHIIMGKQYAERLGFPCQAPYLSEHQHGDFAYYPEQGVIVCPYFDYRQLSNIKITALVQIMLQWITHHGLGGKAF